MKRSTLIRNLLFQILMLVFFCAFTSLMPFNCGSSKHLNVKTEQGPFPPYGGKRETIFDKDSIPVEVKEYDAKGTLRRHTTRSHDAKNRTTEASDLVYDENKDLTRGAKFSRTYADELDVAGKTIYSKYDPQTKKFIPVKPLVSGYEQAMINKPPDSLKLDPFYKKYTNANGIPIVSSEKVPDAALLIARDIVNFMLMKRQDVRRELMKRRSRVMIMAENEMETDLPERRYWKKPERYDQRLTPFEKENYDKPGGIGSMTDKGYWNQRTRGMGGNEVSCAEENLLGYAGTRYYGENILVHEFSHNIMSAIETADPALYAEIQQAYNSALSKGLYKNQYAINTVNEYWAEGSQWWFWSNIEFYDGVTRIQSPDDLKAYDPVLYHIFERVYEGHKIPADVYYSLNLSPVR